MKRLIFSVLALSAVIITSPALFATQVLPLNLNKIVSAAEFAFAGLCIDVKVEKRKDKHFANAYDVTTYTFLIEEPLKGALKKGQLHKFSQWGSARGKGIVGNRVIGQVEYKKNKRYVLFLTPTSKTGLTSPIGLNQGALNIIVTANGQKSVKSPVLKSVMSRQLKATPGLQKSLGVGGAQNEMSLDNFLEIIGEIKK